MSAIMKTLLRGSIIVALFSFFCGAQTVTSIQSTQYITPLIINSSGPISGTLNIGAMGGGQ